MHSRFKAAWAELPEKLQSVLRPIIDKSDFQGMLTAEQVEQIKAETSVDDALAFALLPLLLPMPSLLFPILTWVQSHVEQVVTCILVPIWNLAMYQWAK